MGAEAAAERSCRERKMTKGALTFAEIFIVLALVFIIQTVANFGLYEADGGGGPEVPDRETLSIRQAPSNGYSDDHVIYLHFSARGVPEVRLAGSAAQRRTCANISSQLDSAGGCEAREPCAGDVFSSDSTVTLLESLYGISVNLVTMDNVQPEYVLSWVPADLPDGAIVRVGLEWCYYPYDTSMLRRPSWALPDGERPHPLIVARTRYGPAVHRDERPREYAHAGMLMSRNEWTGSGRDAWEDFKGNLEISVAGGDEGLGMSLRIWEPDGAQGIAGAVFAMDGCRFEGGDIRGFSFREIAIPLSCLQKPKSAGFSLPEALGCGALQISGQHQAVALYNSRSRHSSQ